MLSFLSPLTPPILIWEESCSEILETIGGPSVSFPANWQTQNHVIQLLTANYWPLRQKSNTFVISSKVMFSNFGLTTNPLLLPFLAFQYQFPPDNSATWLLSQSLVYSYCIYPVWKMLLLIFCPAHPHTPLDQSPPQLSINQCCPTYRCAFFQKFNYFLRLQNFSSNSKWSVSE